MKILFEGREMNEYCNYYIKINQKAIIHNARFFKNYSKKKLIAVIKSNAYGHGLIEVGKILDEEADVFAVAALDCALKLRKEGIKKPILVLNPLDSDYVNLALDNEIMITVNNLEELKQVGNKIRESENKLQVHLKVDTGMNRMGLKSLDEAKELIEFSKDLNVEIVGIYTHYHSPDNEILSKNQKDRFLEIYDGLNYPFTYVHLCSTTATLNNHDIENSTHVRIGLGLYGICESSEVKPALSLNAKIMIKKLVKKNETIGYSAKYQANEDIWIGILPIGYSDGIIRANTGRKVYIDGHFCEIVGNVCMNSLMVKLPDKDIGDEVELIGEHITALEIAKHLNTISYEVTTILPPYIKRMIV